MAKTPTPLEFHTEIEFKDKVPLAQRKAIIEAMQESIQEALGCDEFTELWDRASIYCHATSQTLELENRS